MSTRTSKWSALRRTHSARVAIFAAVSMTDMVDPWPLTGRIDELRLVSEALTEGGRQGIVIAGHAGVGKTRLARTAAELAAEEGWAVRRIAGTATGRAVSLGAFARWADVDDASPLALARKVFGDLAYADDAPPLLLVVDDAHLLDDLSALIVHHIALQGIAGVIATIRTGERAPDAVTALWKDGLLRRLELQPLSRDESDRLLLAALDGPVDKESSDRMWRLSRGNVLFLYHLVEHERQSGALDIVDGQWRSFATLSASPSLIELVDQQVGAVPDDVGEVVDLVAIAEPLDPGVLAALVDPDLIEAAEQRGLITSGPSGDAVYVGHPLYGEIRLSRCGPRRMRRLRGRLATVMATEGAEVDPLRLGLLWLESDLAPNIEILSRAAHIAGSRLDVGLAERFARAAVETSASPFTKLQLAYILFLQEKGGAAEAILDTLDFEDMAVPGVIDGVILRAGNLLWPLRDTLASSAVIEDALRMGDEQRNQSLRTFRAVQHAMAAQPAETVSTMARVNYDRLDSFSRLFGYSAETIALGDLGDVDRASHLAAEGYRVLDESPLDSFHGTGLAEFHAYAMLAAGYVAEAHAISERQYRKYADLPGLSQSMAVGAVGMTALGIGDLNAALRHFATAQAGFGEYGNISGLFYRFRILHTEALARSGDMQAAVQSLDSTTQNRHPAYEYVESNYLLASAWVAANRGHVPEACEIAFRAAEFARAHGQPAREVMCLQAAAQFGDPSGVDRLTDLAARVQGPRAPAAARYARALAADDAAALDAASVDFATMGDTLAAADAAAQAATAHRRAGLRGSALTSSARARSIAGACGNAVSPALTAARVPLPFTRREHEIAKLLSEGLTNRAIAEAMSVSVRTVEGHIYQASSKAGVSSRAELSALVKQFSELDTEPDPG